MAETKGTKIELVLGATPGKLVRFSYPHVFKPQLNTQSGDMEYGVKALIPKGNTEDIAAVRAAIKRLQKETWLDEGKKLPPQFWNPLKDGDEDTKQDGSPLGPECIGNFVLNCKSGEEYQPNVVGTARDAKGQFIPLQPRELKSGDWGRLKVNLRAFTTGTGGVGVYLSSLQLKRQGDSLGGGSSAESDFKDFLDEDDADDSALYT